MKLTTECQPQLVFYYIMLELPLEPFKEQCILTSYCRSTCIKNLFHSESELLVYRKLFSHLSYLFIVVSDVLTLNIPNKMVSSAITLENRDPFSNSKCLKEISKCLFRRVVSWKDGKRLPIRYEGWAFREYLPLGSFQLHRFIFRVV